MDASSDPPPRPRRGLLIVLSSPSGAGKSTISRMLMDADPEVTMSVSATTRPRRPGEVDHVDYHFVDDAEFDRMIAAGEFVEWAPVFGYRYGTPKAPVKAALRDGPRHPVRHRLAGHPAAPVGDGRGSGARSSSCRPRWPSSSGACARAAPTREEVIADRMQRAASEISHWAEYEYVLVNDEMEACLADVRAIVAAERLKRVAPGRAGHLRPRPGRPGTLSVEQLQESRAPPGNRTGGSR